MIFSAGIISNDLLRLAKLKGFKYEQRIVTSINSLGETYEYGIYGITQSLLQKWLREEHQIIVTITPTFTYSLITHIGYYCTIETPNEDLYSMECKNPDLYFYSTYEEAFEAGLREGLNLIK